MLRMTLAAVLFCFGCVADTRAADDGGSRLAALVGDRPVTVREVARRIRAAGTDPRKAGAEKWKAALESSIAHALILEAVERDGLSLSREEAARLPGRPDGGKDQRRARERALARKWLAAQLGTRLLLPPARVRRWYEQHAREFARPERRVARVITLRPGKSEKALAEAGARLDKLRKEVLDGASFADVAKKHSEDPWAAEGGLLEPLAEKATGSVFAPRLFALKKPGDVSPPFQTTAGVHILKLEKVIPGETPPFEKVRAEIRRRLLRQQQRKELDRLLDKLRRRTVVRVFWANIEQGGG
jgi:hypothetical protein